MDTAFIFEVDQVVCAGSVISSLKLSKVVDYFYDKVASCCHLSILGKDKDFYTNYL